LPYAWVEYYCNHHNGLERARIPIFRDRKVKNDALEPIFSPGLGGYVVLKALKAGPLRTKEEIEKFLKTHFESLGASHIKINYERGW